MPAQRQTSGFMAAMGGQIKQAHEAHKGDELKLGGGGELPPGIENGVAQLKDCRFSIFKEGKLKGKYFFYLSGIAMEPKESPIFTMKNGKPVQTGTARVEGIQFNLTEPMCETPDRTSRKTFEEHYAFVLNCLRKFKIDTKQLGENELESTAQALKEAKPHFNYRTWKGEATAQYPNPRVNVDWGMLCDYNPDEGHDGVEDATAQTNGDGKPAWEADAANEEGEGDSPEATEATETSGEAISADDLPALGEAADGGDIDAQRKLEGQAKLAGIDYVAAESWTAVAAELAEQDAAAEAPAEEPWKPVKGSVCQYKPPKARKLVQCEISAVFDGKQTVNLKNLDDGSSYKAVPWAQLVQV